MISHVFPAVHAAGYSSGFFTSCPKAKETQGRIFLCGVNFQNCLFPMSHGCYLCFLIPILESWSQELFKPARCQSFLTANVLVFYTGCPRSLFVLLVNFWVFTTEHPMSQLANLFSFLSVLTFPCIHILVYLFLCFNDKLKCVIDPYFMFPRSFWGKYWDFFTVACSFPDLTAGQQSRLLQLWANTVKWIFFPFWNGEIDTSWHKCSTGNEYLERLTLRFTDAVWINANIASSFSTVISNGLLAVARLIVVSFLVGSPSGILPWSTLIWVLIPSLSTIWSEREAGVQDQALNLLLTFDLKLSVQGQAKRVRE